MADQHTDLLLAALLAQYNDRPQPELRTGDPSVFREPTLANTILGRYAPSGLLARYYNPETREGAQWSRRIGGLLDDLLAPFMATQARSTGPLMRDAVTAARLERNMPRHAYRDAPVDPGVTGGRNNPLDSAEGLVNRMDANEWKRYGPDYLPVRHPEFKYQGRGASNQNAADLRVNNPYMDASLVQQWRRYTQSPEHTPPS